MAGTKEALRELYVQKIRSEVSFLEAKGICVTGNAFSQVLLMASEFDDASVHALSASLDRLGYVPQDREMLICPSDPLLLRQALCVLDPYTLVLCDEVSAQTLREAYADELSDLERLDDALFLPGSVVYILGIRMLNLGNFADALSNKYEKQIMWTRLKKIPPIKEPY